MCGFFKGQISQQVGLESGYILLKLKKKNPKILFHISENGTITVPIIVFFFSQQCGAQTNLKCQIIIIKTNKK